MEDIEDMIPELVVRQPEENIEDKIPQLVVREASKEELDMLAEQQKETEAVDVKKRKISSFLDKKDTTKTTPSSSVKQSDIDDTIDLVTSSTTNSNAITFIRTANSSKKPGSSAHPIEIPDVVQVKTANNEIIKVVPKSKIYSVSDLVKKAASTPIPQHSHIYKPIQYTASSNTEGKTEKKSHKKPLLSKIESKFHKMRDKVGNVDFSDFENLGSFMKLYMCDQTNLYQWCVSKGLLTELLYCSVCQVYAEKRKRNKLFGFEFFCPSKRHEYPVTENSMFSDLTEHPRDVLLFLRMYLETGCQDLSGKEAGFPEHIFSKWTDFVQTIFIEDMVKALIELSLSGEIFVEKLPCYMKLTEATTEGPKIIYIYLICEAHNSKIVMVPVASGLEANLLLFLQNLCAEGTTILSKGFPDNLDYSEFPFANYRFIRNQDDNTRFYSINGQEFSADVSKFSKVLKKNVSLFAKKLKGNAASYEKFLCELMWRSRNVDNIHQHFWNSVKGIYKLSSAPDLKVKYPIFPLWGNCKNITEIELEIESSLENSQILGLSQFAYETCNSAENPDFQSQQLQLQQLQQEQQQLLQQDQEQQLLPQDQQMFNNTGTQNTNTFSNKTQQSQEVQININTNGIHAPAAPKVQTIRLNQASTQPTRQTRNTNLEIKNGGVNIEEDLNASSNLELFTNLLEQNLVSPMSFSLPSQGPSGATHEKTVPTPSPVSTTVRNRQLPAKTTTAAKQKYYVFTK